MPAVMKDGKTEQFVVKINGEHFKCPCGCNVFQKPDDTKMNIYQCNSCGTQFKGS